MEQHPIKSPASGDSVPRVLDIWLRAFRPHVTWPTWQNLLVLVMGALLAPGKRTVSACLRITGRSDASNTAFLDEECRSGPFGVLILDLDDFKGKRPPGPTFRFSI